METGKTEATPDLDELNQEAPAGVRVPVEVHGQVLTHELPAKRVQESTDLISAGAWTHVLPKTPKRKRAVLLGDVPFRVSFTGTGSGMAWPANVPLVLEHDQAVHVQASTGVVALSHMSELWAD